MVPSRPTGGKGGQTQHSTTWQKPGEGTAGHGRVPGANTTWNMFLEPGQSGPPMTSSIFLNLFSTQPGALEGF